MISAPYFVTLTCGGECRRVIVFRAVSVAQAVKAAQRRWPGWTAVAVEDVG